MKIIAQLLVVAIPMFVGCSMERNLLNGYEHRDRAEIAQRVIDMSILELCQMGSGQAMDVFVEVYGGKIKGMKVPDCKCTNVNVRVYSMGSSGVRAINDKRTEASANIMVSIVMQIGVVSPSILYDVSRLPARFDAVAIVTSSHGVVGIEKEYIFFRYISEEWKVVDRVESKTKS